MARTKIVIEIESTDERFIKAAGDSIVEFSRYCLKAFSDKVPIAQAQTSITHDGKDVTEVIQ